MNNVSSGTCTADFLGYIVYFNHCTDYKNKERKGNFCINHVQWDERFYNNDDSDGGSFIEGVEFVQINN